MKGFGLDTTRVLFEPWAWLLVLLLSALGVVGNLALCKLGQKGEKAVASRFPRIDPARWKRAGELFETRGAWILLLSACQVSWPKNVIHAGIGRLARITPLGNPSGGA